MTSKSANQILAPNLALGMNPNADGASTWVQNLTRKAGDGGWTTRPGFGLLARADSSLTSGKLSYQQDMGISRVLGITAFRTPWGTKQIIALCRNQAWLGSNYRFSINGKFGVVYSLIVYDLTYDTVQEHTIHRHTSEESGKENWQKRGHYNTDIVVDRQQWVDAGAADLIGSRVPVDREEAWFTEPTGGVVLFGTPRLGAYAYTPVPPAHGARTQANVVMAREWSPPTSEDGVVVPVVLRNSYADAEQGYTYLTPEEFGRPTAAVVVGSRVVYAVDNTVLWSNPEDPSTVIIDNIDVFEDNIVALGSVLGVLYVFTANSTYLLSPGVGFVVSGGDLRLLSAEVGALSPACVTRYANTLAVAHSSGIYIVNGGTGMQEISAPLMPLFDGEGLESPWTQFAQTTMTTIGAKLPQVYYRLNNQTSIGAHLTTDDAGRMIFGLPEMDLGFVFEGGEWHVWNVNTLVNNDEAVLATNNLPTARYVALGEDVFMVAGPTLQLQTDEAPDGEWDAPNRSIAFLQLGRGGSLDRNSGTKEDQRYIAGDWIQAGFNFQTNLAARDRGFFYLNPPVEIPPNTLLDWAGVTIGAAEQAFYVPITLVPRKASTTPGGNNPRDFYLSFAFDNVNFEPIINANAAQVYEPVFRLPVERLSAAGAFALGVADEALLKGIYVFDTGTGLPDPAGDEIRIFVDSAFGGAWTGHPDFNFQRRTHNPICSIAFKRKSVAGGIFTFVMTPLTGSVNTALAAYPTGAFVWRDTLPEIRSDWYEADDNNAQAVDWLLHGAEIAAEGEIMKTQGVILRSQTSGQSTSNVIGVSYPAGLLNMAMSANRTGESGQTTDITPPMSAPPGWQNVTHDPLVARLGNPVTNAVFNGLATWGDDTLPAKGNFLIADTPTDRLTIPGRMSGDAMRVTIYGHVRDKAERFKPYTVACVLRMMGGGVRRRGR